MLQTKTQMPADVICVIERQTKPIRCNKILLSPHAKLDGIIFLCTFAVVQNEVYTKLNWEVRVKKVEVCCSRESKWSTARRVLIDYSCELKQLCVSRAASSRSRTNHFCSSMRSTSFAPYNNSVRIISSQLIWHASMFLCVSFVTEMVLLESVWTLGPLIQFCRCKTKNWKTILKIFFKVK